MHAASFPTWPPPPRFVTLVLDAFPKQCGCCGKLHNAADWGLLKRLGLQEVVLESDELGYSELRNCACGSTMSIEVEP